VPASNDPNPRAPATNVDPQAWNRAWGMGPGAPTSNVDQPWNRPKNSPEYLRWHRENWNYHGFEPPYTSNGVSHPPQAIGPGASELEGMLGVSPGAHNYSSPAEINEYLRQHGYTDHLGFHPGSTVPPYRGRDQAAGDNDSDDE